MCVSMCVVCTLCVLYLETGVGVTFTNVLQQLSTGLANVAGRLQEVLPGLMGYGCKQKQNQQKNTNEHKHAFKGMSSKLNPFTQFNNSNSLVIQPNFAKTQTFKYPVSLGSSTERSQHFHVCMRYQFTLNVIKLNCFLKM